MERYPIRTEKKKRKTRLKELLRERGIKQYELAELADVERYQVSELVTGKKNDILMSTAKRICNALDCSLDEAFGD